MIHRLIKFCVLLFITQLGKGQTLGLSDHQKHELEALRMVLKQTAIEKPFLTGPQKLLIKIYKELHKQTEAIALAQQTQEGVYAYQKFQSLLHTSFNLFSGQGIQRESLYHAIKSYILFDKRNDYFLKWILEDLQSFYRFESKKSIAQVGHIAFAKIIKNSSRDPIIEHIIFSYDWWREQHTTFEQKWLPKLSSLRQNLQRHASEDQTDLIMEMLKKALPSLTQLSQWRLLQEIERLDPTDIELLKIFSQWRHFDFAQFLRGAHFVLEDHGLTYHKLRKNPMIKTHIRRSSHYPKSAAQQYGLAEKSKVFHEILFGFLKKENKNYTWIQTEKYGFGLLKTIDLGFTGLNIPSNRFLESWQHIQSYSDHIRSHFRQVGPYGFSQHSEKVDKAIFLSNSYF